MTSTLAQLPAPLSLDPAYSRHAPQPSQQAGAMRALASTHDWACLAWPDLVEALFALGRTDIPLARLTEGHADALRILREAGCTPVGEALYAVWASRSYASGLRGSPGPAPGTWTLTGTLRFASGAGIVERALVPVWVDEDHHVLLDLPVRNWTFDETDWRTRAMALSRSHRVTFAGVAVPAVEVGDTDFYLTRPGFFPGGIGVAAVWTGAGGRLCDLLDAAVPAPLRTPGQVTRRGLMRTDLTTAAVVCRAAGRACHDGIEGDGRVLATECRSAAASAVRRIVDQARVVAGPAGLAYDEDLTRAVDDLFLYAAQQNADSDLAFLGGLA
ncbi:MAG: hypothetical protein ACOYBY_10280 [Dermatophilaceae bacterium]